MNSFTRHLIPVIGLAAMTLWTPDLAHAQPETFTIAAANSVKDALRKILPLFEAEHPEVTTLAQGIVTTQQTEISEMQGYLRDWYGMQGQ